MSVIKNLASKVLKGYFSEMNFTLPITFTNLKSATAKENPYSGSNIIGSYSNANWVYACVREIAENISNLPINIKNKETFKTVTDSKIGELLKYVNSISNKSDFFASIASYLELRGECVIIKDGVSSRGGVPKSLHIKDPVQFDYVLNEEGTKIKYWTYKYYDKNGAEKQINYDVNNIIFMRYFNPYHPIRGLAPLEAARSSIMEEFRAKQYNINFFDNDASVSGVLQTNGNIQESVFKRLEETIRQKYTGSDKAGKLLVLEGGLEYKPIALSHKDMQYLESRKMTREEICSVFRVPPPIVGIFEYANYANAEQAYISFWTKTLLPKIKFIEEVLNKNLFNLHEPDNFMSFDITEVPVLQALLSKKMDTAIKMRNIGYPLEIIDEKLNIDFLKDYDLSDFPETPPADNTLQIFSSDKEVSLYSVTTLQDTAKDFINKVFDNNTEKILKFVDAINIKAKSASNLPLHDLVFDISYFIDEINSVIPSIKDKIIDFAETPIISNLDEPFYLSYTNVDKYFNNKLNIDDSLKCFADDINSLLLTEYQTNKSVNHNLVISLLDKQKDTILGLIKQQIHYLFNACQYESMKINNVKDIKWFVTDPKSCRKNHAMLHNKCVDIGEVFENGELFPLQNLDFENNLNCKCIILPKTKKSG